MLNDLKSSYRGTHRATMIDVAKAAGVSLKTVSRVLNDETYVKDATRQIVLEAAKNLNYQLNQVRVHCAQAARGSLSCSSIIPVAAIWKTCILEH